MNAAIETILGCWRPLLRPFAIPARKMTVSRLKLRVDDPIQAERVDAILSSFAGGFNRMITKPSQNSWKRYCGELPAVLQPFAHEGVAMGFIPRHLFQFDAAKFENEIVRPRPDMRYLYYVGLGFWAGMRNFSPHRLNRLVDGLDPLHRYLCYDGYGFKVAFFDHVEDDNAMKRLASLEGYARNAAFQGAGRALWFRFMDDRDTLISQFKALGENAVDAAAGAGLASVFVNPDRLHIARRLGSDLPGEWQPHFQLGMCFALKARIINNPDHFDGWMQIAGRDVSDAAFASIRECDRIELTVRSESLGDHGYREWRKRVTAWLSDNVVFPMSGMRSAPVQVRPHGKIIKQPSGIAEVRDNG